MVEAEFGNCASEHFLSEPFKWPVPSNPSLSRPCNALAGWLVFSYIFYNEQLLPFIPTELLNHWTHHGVHKHLQSSEHFACFLHTPHHKLLSSIIYQQRGFVVAVTGVPARKFISQKNPKKVLQNPNTQTSHGKQAGDILGYTGR